jgi:hypothetical protein
VSSILDGLQRAEGQGLKTWETYFLLLTEEQTSDPYKPGSNRSWFSKYIYVYTERERGRERGREGERGRERERERERD